MGRRIRRAAIDAALMVSDGPARRLVCLVAAGWLAIACGVTTKVTRDAVRATVDELAVTATWQKLQVPARGIAAAVVGGVLDGLGVELRREAIDDALDHYIDRLSQAAATALDQRWSPAIEHAVRATVRGAIDEALSAPTRDAAADLTNRIMVSALDAVASETRARLGPAMREVLENDLGPALRKVLEKDLGPAMSTVLTRDLGPAMREVLENDLGPGFRTVIADDLTPSLAKLAEATSSAAVRGAVSGADGSLAKVLDPRITRLETALGHAGDRAMSIASVIAIAAAAVLIAVLGMLALWHWRRARDHRTTLTLAAQELDQLLFDPAHASAVRGLHQILAAGAGGARAARGGHGNRD